ncbi:hypothetical protein QFZ28_003268 [Neobacillus niacini]|uniref:hypothetical protein n=1 Tax=Neobacillus niacini TaxID=86668 RepID=UPI002781A781|nr:hypothetical protein [Neobacillus niacini]MDQ1002868.1 hypothetical protein [Neobacillus niacini]
MSDDFHFFKPPTLGLSAHPAVVFSTMLVHKSIQQADQNGLLVYLERHRQWLEGVPIATLDVGTLASYRLRT